jgi:hypothetical protein
LAGLMGWLNQRSTALNASNGHLFHPTTLFLFATLSIARRFDG